jgi:hypothetical protein
MIYSRLFQMAEAAVDPPIVSSTRVALSTPHVITGDILMQQRPSSNPKFNIEIHFVLRLLTFLLNGV